MLFRSASGGGGATDDSTTLGHGLIHGGTPLASTENGNLGHAGADAVTNNDGPRFNSGGGGGAGAAATNYNGGDGYPCDITGTTVYYGGGGRGGKRYGGGTTPQAGKGGGKANFGGGGDGAYGSGNPETGGPGVVIVSYTRSERETTGNFTITGWEANGYRGSQPERYAHIVITNETTLHVTGSASLEVLLVGGGGGSGGYLAGYYGGGGGGGGVVHAHNLPVSAGDYTIAIGAGGPVNVSYSDATTCMAGGSTTAFGFTAFGGGPGAQGGGYGSAINNIGASGGGGARNDNGGYVKAGGTAKSLLYNIGHNGADSVNFSNPGGGGGAGAAGSGSNGGDGYLCNITGVAAYYAGGGSGGSGTVGLGGGVASFGGGGSSGTTSTSAQTGGKGVVIIRYKKPKAGMVIVLQ